MSDDMKEDVAPAAPDELQKRSVADAVGGYILAQKKRGRSSIPMDELEDVRASITDAFTFYRCRRSLHHSVAHSGGNLFAYTALGPTPAYCSINKTADGSVTVTVRSVDGRESSVEIPQTDALALLSVKDHP